MNQERTLAFWSGTKKSNQEQRKGYNLWTRNTRKILLEMVPGIWGLVPKPEKSQIRNEMEQRTAFEAQKRRKFASDVAPRPYHLIPEQQMSRRNGGKAIPLIPKQEKVSQETVPRL